MHGTIYGFSNKPDERDVYYYIKKTEDIYVYSSQDKDLVYFHCIYFFLVIS
jgi:hypothetical protein